ncbi:accessory Sec system protein Asp1 [Streptococcus suis]|uniref:accessory Sec system protein Asp1 n=1 Tax=Streptococcus suis TaxID=1307 RepID=UPI001ABE4249|nr:accessory Sec system protein Asp1 [Streptococcus suis]
MYYFVPSWYGEQNKWVADSLVWYRTIEQVSFDDTINQVKMFETVDESASLILLGYQPQLRYFFHKQGLHKVSYWSFFDDIQNVHRSQQSAIHFKELDWPRGTEFIYSPFAVIAQREGKLLAEIHFAEDGNLLYIHFGPSEKEEQRYIFDDRGFLSSLIIYEDGHPAYQDFLNSNGVWQVREWFGAEDHRLEINPLADKNMEKSFYSSWEELILERLRVFKGQVVEEDDIFVITANKQHTNLFLQTFPQHHKMFSFFGQRFDWSDKILLSAILRQSQHVLVDTDSNEERLLQFCQFEGLNEVEIHRMTPFDTRLRLGQSQNIREMIFYCLVDHLEGVDSVVDSLLQLLAGNPLFQVCFVTYNRSYPLQNLEHRVIEKIHQNFDPNQFFNAAEGPGENQVDESDSFELKSIRFELLSNENQIIQELDSARLVIDLSTQPDLYTQIAALSAGIPQITAVKTDYVEHKENGWVLNHPRDLEQAVQYFCQGLANWNRSLVKSVEMMSDYTSGNMVEQWKGFFES